jgi:hypothetical protein
MIARTATITGLSERETREIIQPTLASSQNRAAELQAELDAFRKELLMWRAQEQFNPLGALWEILKTTVTLILQIWILGLLIESLWLAIHVAANVQRIREVADEQEGKELKTP